jgi:uncharacterized protein (DUF58 family)
MHSVDAVRGRGPGRGRDPLQPAPSDAPNRWKQRVRRALRPPRRLRILRPGALLIGGTLALGLATLNTGNNLLYLLLGALLGFIALSGWLSEKAVQGVSVARRFPRAMTAGETVSVAYVVRNDKRHLPSCCLELHEAERRGEAFVAMVEAGGHASARGAITFPRRGVYPLSRIIVSTSFPFGLFAKERDVEVPGSIIVWPRADRAVRTPRRLGAAASRALAGTMAARGAERGQFRGLRTYRAGDDPRDVHWRTSARLPEPVVREYDRDTGDTYWLCLDTRCVSEASGEGAVEVAAALAARAAARGDQFGFACRDGTIGPGAGPGQLEAVLDLLAAVHMGPGGGIQLPGAPAECILVTPGQAPAGRFGDVYAVREVPHAPR